MGSIVKVTMPLLSTLAALVIIVHTAEENYDREYRGIRRALDVEQPNYDQSWRAVDVSPVVTQTMPQNQEGWNDDSPDQPIRRRRRKRKRRPQFSIQDGEMSSDTYIFKNEAPVAQEDNIEMTGRRRKKGNDHDAEEYNRPGYRSGQSPNKPLRRRGQRRRRPLVVESWPELSEFNRNRQDKSENEETSENYKSQNDNVYIIPDINNEEGVDIAPENQHIYSDEHYIEQKPILVNANDETKHDSVLPRDRSLSEFSSELVQPAQSSNIPLTNPADKIKDKTISISNEINKSQEREPLDPRSLKALLKRSNGKSLSEILQQNNLSLSDLLNGKARALSILQTGNEADADDHSQLELENNISTTIVPLVSIPDIGTENKVNKENGELDDCDTTDLNINDKGNTSDVTEHEKHNDVENSTKNEKTPKGYIRHRFPIGSRRRLRLHPKTNSTSQRHINRDIINLTSVKYKNSRHINKSKEWKEVLSSMMTRRPSSTETTKLEFNTDDDKITTTLTFEETTTEEIFETTTEPSVLSMNTEVTFYADSNMESDNTADSSKSFTKSEILPPAIEIIDKEIITEKETLPGKPKLSPLLRPLVNSSVLRRQAFSNRLKRKRLKQKDVSTEKHDIKNIFSTANFVSASKFIEKTQTKATNADTEAYTTLEDFMTTEPVQTVQMSKSTKNSIKTTKVIRPTAENIPYLTQDSAKYEIEEILNDSISSARLSKILKERNMTLNELVEHRERGSSHVHLADIFHNASKEPNPPEPFLSKSLIEPISREIYPLRALLEANLHDPKTTIDTNSALTNNLNIPVVMDFGNNVNENGENMGIISLFNNISKINNDMNIKDDKMNVDSEKLGTERESRTSNVEKDSITWNDLITLMQRNHQNENDVKIKTDNSPIYENLKNIKFDEEVDGNGLTVLDDLQNLKNFDTLPTSDELLEIKLYENNEFSTHNTIDSSFSTTTKSVTVATVTIIGLALVLFLFTYGMLKWKQQSKVYQNKHSIEDEYVPSPVFENRKGQKINSSTRSKSPMLSSNIYAIDSLDTHVGNDSPEYMWDSLRKPFQ